jgi:hypothetical protein
MGVLSLGNPEHLREIMCLVNYHVLRYAHLPSALTLSRTGCFITITDQIFEQRQG